MQETGALQGDGMKICTIVAAVIASALLFLTAESNAQTQDHAQIIAIRADRVLEPETGHIAPDQIILIDGKRIKEMGGNVEIPAGAKVVDLSKDCPLGSIEFTRAV